MSEPSVANTLRRPRAPRKTASTDPVKTTTEASEASPGLDTSYLETLLGYNARRAALSVIAVFLRRMAPFGLRPVDFSVLTLIAHNPGVTSRQLCAELDILPPNLVGMIKSLDKRGLIERKPHPSDRRAQGLHLSAEGKRLQKQAQTTATRLEHDVSHALTPAELETLNTLLRKVYLR
ncbi:MAG TPA: MarR family transcriptional regulator [Hydrogenophaga sp.]|jgi:DNA-binding MarR family transcriptional regulator|uniref:MarR family winged helix-turn-helix transcriptional regulator n=1 Tax=Hydrogenophaga sp. TaxID=1904254 RepID=UPI0008D31B5B|nr:MarR family winged helix-turn-helix transcriptional regulator [Hydrogenophaga sp.]MBU4180954.1 MarR family winged helix-turn-helix transcriptional regulator [Gammaproteobacteria bacterium]OGA77800.1 MAG: MarR family transcriptional regulator [Burkholderiales bacterium GWE1_65_30]OGA94151.1 MAG: MarR family transcriptional regulator [Burkholderiales bacterium GWF1_66_17]OGB16601.1 MAG: MarR family transcriptional regulator [Burkholderiales bacterium RIFCSPHIGHO2_02_FULL_66_10]OGB33263.1 MAG: